MCNGRVGSTRAFLWAGTSWGQLCEKFRGLHSPSKAKSKEGGFTCIPYYTISVNKAAVFNGRVQNEHASVFLATCFHACVCAVEQRVSVPPWLQRWCCKPEQENKLESQEEKSFMSDALIRKTTRSPQSRISWLIFRMQLGTTWHKQFKQYS